MLATQREDSSSLPSTHNRQQTTGSGDLTFSLPSEDTCMHVHISIPSTPPDIHVHTCIKKEKNLLCNNTDNPIGTKVAHLYFGINQQLPDWT